MHFYSHHIGDFVKATARLSNDQVMTYLRMIWEYYDSEAPLPNDPELIACIVGSDEATVRLVIKLFFVVDGDVIRNSRCDKELQGYKAKSEGGKKGAKSRWGSMTNPKDTHSLPIAIPMQVQCDPNANHKPITNNQIKPSSSTPDGFDEFWSAYDKKVGKQNAIKEWKKLKPDADLVAKIVSAARRQASANEPKYRKDPERWIKGQHWDDEIVPKNGSITPAYQPEMI